MLEDKMKKSMWPWILAFWFVLFTVTAHAGLSTGPAAGSAPMIAGADNLSLGGILETLVFGVIGILLSILGYKTYDLITPFSLTKELEEDQNTAVGIVVAGMIIGVSIIVAAAIV